MPKEGWSWGIYPPSPIGPAIGQSVLPWYINPCHFIREGLAFGKRGVGLHGDGESQGVMGEHRGVCYTHTTKKNSPWPVHRAFSICTVLTCNSLASPADIGTTAMLQMKELRPGPGKCITDKRPKGGHNSRYLASNRKRTSSRVGPGPGFKPWSTSLGFTEL